MRRFELDIEVEEVNSDMVLEALWNGLEALEIDYGSITIRETTAITKEE